MNDVSVQKQTDLNTLIKSEKIQNRFNEVLGKRAPGFISSLISAANSNPALKDCEPMSIVSAGMIAAAMDLTVNPNLGHAWIVPYAGKAQFQMGWKGYVQLALRTAQYKTINATQVYEGQIKSIDTFTGEIEFVNEKTSDKIIGYLCYFKLINGFEKKFFWTTEQCQAHGKRYSKMYQRNKGLWVEDFDVMAMKTVVKMALSKWGILSIEMQRAIEFDESISNNAAMPEYPDNPLNPGDAIPPEPLSNLKSAMRIDTETKPE